jgi:hypothetical protein
LPALLCGSGFALFTYSSFHAGQNLAVFEFGAMLFANLAGNVSAFPTQTRFDITLGFESAPYSGEFFCGDATPERAAHVVDFLGMDGLRGLEVDPVVSG